MTERVKKTAAKAKFHEHQFGPRCLGMALKRHSKEEQDFHTNVFLGQSPKAIDIRAKINKRDLVKLTSFCTAKETINKMKRQPTEWEKIFANDANNKGLIFQNIQIANTTQQQKNPDNPIEKWAEDLNRHFSSEDI